MLGRYRKGTFQLVLKQVKTFSLLLIAACSFATGSFIQKIQQLLGVGEDKRSKNLKFYSAKIYHPARSRCANNYAFYI